MPHLFGIKHFQKEHVNQEFIAYDTHVNGRLFGVRRTAQKKFIDVTQFRISVIERSESMKMKQEDRINVYSVTRRRRRRWNNECDFQSTRYFRKPSFKGEQSVRTEKGFRFSNPSRVLALNISNLIVSYGLCHEQKQKHFSTHIISLSYQ